MQVFTFQPDLTMPILKDAIMLISESFDAFTAQEVLINSILPSAFSMLGTKVRIQIVEILQDENHQAHYSMLLEKPADYPDNLIRSIYSRCGELGDSYERNLHKYSDTLYRITFKVG